MLPQPVSPWRIELGVSGSSLPPSTQRFYLLSPPRLDKPGAPPPSDSGGWRLRTKQRYLQAMPPTPSPAKAGAVVDRCGAGARKTRVSAPRCEPSPTLNKCCTLY